MNIDYTIHIHEGIKFINLSKRDIVTEDGSIYPPESTEYVITDDKREDYGVIYDSTQSLKTRSVLLFNNLPDNISAEHAYTEGLTFTELIHLPHPGELEWIESLPGDVLVIATPKVAQTYGYPVCMFRTKRNEQGIHYHIVKALVWSKIL